METILRLLAENPESLGEVVKTYITKYKEPVYDVLKELMIIAKDYSENTEYPAIQARTKKNMFDAYVSVGFTEDQALALMINDNIQLMKNIQKSVNNTSVKKSKQWFRSKPIFHWKIWINNNINGSCKCHKIKER